MPAPLRNWQSLSQIPSTLHCFSLRQILHLSMPLSFCSWGLQGASRPEEGTIAKVMQWEPLMFSSQKPKDTEGQLSSHIKWKEILKEMPGKSALKTWYFWLSISQCSLSFTASSCLRKRCQTYNSKQTVPESAYKEISFYCIIWRLVFFNANGLYINDTINIATLSLFFSKPSTALVCNNTKSLHQMCSS